MSNEAEGLADLHWMFDMLHHIDVGLVVLNEKYEVQLWNSFMENHSGVSSSIAKQQSLLSIFPNLDTGWLRQKMDNVFGLKTPIYISWEQRPNLFPFKSYRPITGIANKMYQNVAIRPISSPNGAIKHLCLVVYDVTDIATNKIALSAANDKLKRLTSALSK
ncbi:transcriptional regulator [Marinomonas colpomeniae]|jgi:hypothetical protein|uniref:Diguanylate cyclase n=1 Tax=Marinomonas colpomeniae TaxID=2774408 RepID=A0ABR8NY39_9GAMM|nr:hypothetical protein [Marinomonas colpomeniae]MBD5770939.1 hypothetical protein [Marinomonas colpomeniae]